MAIGTGVCWEYMFIGTGMKIGTGTGTTTTFTVSCPAEVLTEGEVRAGGGNERRERAREIRLRHPTVYMTTQRKIN